MKDYLDSFIHVVKNTVISDSSFTEIKQELAIDSVIFRLLELRRSKKTLYLIGNGGSNGIISHASVDFINTCKIRAVPLTDSSMITCFANDFGYENVFSTPLEIMIEKNDILIAISSSGNSKNILNAVEIGIKKEASIITFSGFKNNNPLRLLGQYNFWVNSVEYGKVEIAHALLLHLLIDFLRIRI
jgi:D-sedoheptulose 7-phosphate isomerase